MGRSPPLGAAALPARRGPPSPRLAPPRALQPRPRPRPPAFAASHRPGAARSRAQRKPGRRPSPDPSPDPAAQPRGPQPTRARPARAQPTTAGPAAAALTSARRPAPALPAPGSRRDGTSPLAVGSPGCWEGKEAGAGRARGQCAAEIARPRVRDASRTRPGGAGPVLAHASEPEGSSVLAGRQGGFGGVTRWFKTVARPSWEQPWEAGLCRACTGARGRDWPQPLQSGDPGGHPAPREFWVPRSGHFRLAVQLSPTARKCLRVGVWWTAAGCLQAGFAWRVAASVRLLAYLGGGVRRVRESTSTRTDPWRQDSGAAWSSRDVSEATGWLRAGREGARPWEA